MDENGFVGPAAVGPTIQEELTNPSLLPVMKIPSFYSAIRIISSLIPNRSATYLDLLGIRLVCTFA